MKDHFAMISGKVECELFDEEINALKNMIAALSTGDDKPAITQQIIAGPSISSKDLNRIKELGVKVNELEELL